MSSKKKLLVLEIFNLNKNKFKIHKNSLFKLQQQKIEINHQGLGFYFRYRYIRFSLFKKNNQNSKTKAKKISEFILLYRIEINFVLALDF